MPAVLLQPLPAISFSKNPIWLKLLSADYQAAAPVNAINYFEFDAAVASAASVVINWVINAVTMTAAAVPDDTGNQFPSGDGSNGYVTSLVPYFQQNYFIDEAFIVSTDFTGPHPRLIFTARKPGTDYNFSAGILSGNLTAGGDGSPKSNFMHHIEIWIANLTGGFDQAFKANVPLDENPLTGVTSIDIHETLHSWLNQPDQYDKPELINPYAQYTRSLRAWFVKYGQFFGAVPSIQKIVKTGLYYAAMGGLSMQNALLRDIIAELNTRFMRQGSINKQVAKDQPEWLSFINLTNATVNMNLEVIIYNDDNSTFTFSALVAAIDIAAYQKYQFQTGYTQLNIGGRQLIAKKPIYYTVKAKTSGGASLTAAYAYVIDNRYWEWPRYFIYENSYGAYQTIATIGKGQDQYDRTKTDAQLTTDRNTAAIDGDFIETNIFIQNKGTVSIGYQRSGKRNTQLLRDLMLSRHTFLYRNGALIPVGLNTQNLKDAMDGNNVYANSFEYYPKYQEDVWTEDAGTPDDSVADLLVDAGSPVTRTALTGDGTIIVEYGDSHLSMVGGHQVYTAPYWLAGITGYRIDSTQLGEYFRTEDISYDSVAGSFTILVPGFVLQPGDQLIIWPFILNPDS